MESLLVTSKQVASIEWDKEKAINDVNEIMKKYDGLTFQEIDLPDAKKELANLRKVAKEINSQALAIDKELTNPVKTFRKEVNEVIAIVNNGIDNIDTQVKEFETKAKLERKKEIMSWTHYDLIKDFIPFNDEWLLKKWTDEKLEELLDEHHNQLTTYITTIKTTAKTLRLESDFYIDKLKTIPYVQVIERMNEDANNLHKTTTKVVIDTTEKPIEITRKITGTKTQLIALKKYALELGCKYEDVK